VPCIRSGLHSALNYSNRTVISSIRFTFQYYTEGITVVSCVGVYFHPLLCSTNYVASHTQYTILHIKETCLNSDNCIVAVMVWFMSCHWCSKCSILNVLEILQHHNLLIHSCLHQSTFSIIIQSCHCFEEKMQCGSVLCLYLQKKYSTWTSCHITPQCCICRTHVVVFLCYTVWTLHCF